MAESERREHAAPIGRKTSADARHPSFSAAMNSSSLPTMTDYLRRHPEGFDETPFSPVDSLVLSALSYLDFDRYRYGDVYAGPHVPLVDIVRFTDLDSMLSGGWIRASRDLPVFLDALLRCHRFADLAIGYFVNENAAALEKQFCACTFSFDAGRSSYIAFRGTDGTFAGWKEDFNLSYRKIIPSQRSAERYLSGVLSALPSACRVFVGGHSKGGNLAEFAAATVDESNFARIERIFNHDGPSYLNAPSPRIYEASFKEKLHKTVPESSIFGMILEHRDDYSVVQSDAAGIFQHNPFTWLVDDVDFLYQDGLNAGAALFDETLDRWLKSCTPEQRETFIDTFYELVVSTDATTWQEFQEGGLIGNVAGVLRDGRNLDAETKEIIAHTMRNLRTVANETVRERLRNFVARMRSSGPGGFAR
ncbi:MAG: DUF2974 domain-containing protein [Slackia piriformis]|uniref:DUF2974 domain-containing protein n=1 Tax=Slackia piriformis TaxID=626934 RepID=A0A943UYJ7_9ACTN|nr:DUF2974 domain-containing protein [Slackia piriformis]